jgi:biopolymer transport protein ExbD
MRFTSGKKRRTPTVIIVSLIDVLLVVLIFLMVTTTAKKEPPPVLKLALPESKQAKPGATDHRPFVVMVATNEPYFYFDNKPVTLDRLQREMETAAKSDPKLRVVIRADRRAPFGEVVKVIDAGRSAQVGSIDTETERAAR